MFKDHNGKDFQVTVMMMFIHGIAPQSEDRTNKGYFRIELGKIKEAPLLQKIWETLVYDCVTGNIPGLDEKDEGLTGIRFVQKSNYNTLNSFRVEIWTKGFDDKLQVYKDIKSYLENNILEDIMGASPGDFQIQFKSL